MTDDESASTQSSTQSRGTTVTVRQAKPGDDAAVATFTQDTWGERHDDYIPRVFDDWIASDDEGQRTFVATLPPAALDDPHPEAVVTGNGEGVAAAGDEEVVVGCVQAVLLTEWESWAQGIRVDPAARGASAGSALTNAVLEWARDAGATVCRNMVFSWNVAGLGQSRAVGFDPATEFRFARPEPDREAVARGDAIEIADPDPKGAWAFWTASDARDHLRGLSLDPGEGWACSELTADRIADAAAEGRLVGVRDADGFAGFALRTRVSERDGDDGVEHHAVYGAAAWRNAEAAGELLAAVSRDAAKEGADVVRVLIPETASHVSDVAANRVEVSGEPDFVLCADLTDPAVGSSR